MNPTNYSFGPNQGLALSNGLLNNADYSIEMIFNFSTLTGFRKVIDFKDRVSDRGLYNLDTTLRFYPFTSGPASAFTTNVDLDLVVTRGATTNRFIGYVDGIQQIAFTDSLGDAILTEPNNIIHFFKDDFVTDQSEASGGVVDRIRIYDGGLTQSEVTALFTGGPPPGFLLQMSPSGKLKSSLR